MELDIVRKEDKADVTGRRTENQVWGHSSTERIAVQMLKWLPCKHENRSLQKSYVFFCACNPNTGKIKTGGSLGIGVRQFNPVSKFHIEWETLSKEINEGIIQGGITHRPSSSLHTYAYQYIQEHKQMHTQVNVKKISEKEVQDTLHLDNHPSGKLCDSSVTPWLPHPPPPLCWEVTVQHSLTLQMDLGLFKSLVLYILFLTLLQTEYIWGLSFHSCLSVLSSLQCLFIEYNNNKLPSTSLSKSEQKLSIKSCIKTVMTVIVNALLLSNIPLSKITSIQLSNGWKDVKT